MMDPLQSNLSDKDRNKLIETYGKDSKFKNLFKNIFGSGTNKKVENFLRETQPTEFMGGETQPTEFLAGMNPDYFGVPESVRNANKFMSGYTKGDFSDPEFIRNFKIIQEFNKKA